MHDGFIYPHIGKVPILQRYVYGMVWYGMVWCGMYGMVWECGVWCGMVWYGIVYIRNIWYEFM